VLLVSPRSLREKFRAPEERVADVTRPEEAEIVTL